ncbi:MAG TPA: PPOX class F420-dependent oxidoreductase [Dehalococcoidia bacterium]|nr:PPOX class F420-dependent oxidoreductase [Dehalococcoidia bacterium]
MTREELQRFLDRPLVAVLSTLRPDGSPHSAPVWYEFQNGRFYFWTGENSVKGRNLRQRPMASVCIPTQEEPYQYVTAQGSCELTKDGLEGRCLSIARRYYDEERAQGFVREDLASGGSLIVVMTPAKIVSERSA